MIGFQLIEWHNDDGTVETFRSAREFQRVKGGEIVRYRRSRQVASLAARRIINEVEEGEMPAALYDVLGWTDGWTYTELGRVS